MCVRFCCELYAGKNHIKAVWSDPLGTVLNEASFGTVLHEASKKFKDEMKKCRYQHFHFVQKP
jgi:hypothetical protein